MPYELAGEYVWLRLTPNTAEIFHNTVRVACHTRNYGKFHRYKTEYDHMPENHKAVTDWSSERFTTWAGKIGPNTERYIQSVLASRDFPQQAYNAPNVADTLSGCFRNCRPDAPE